MTWLPIMGNNFNNYGFQSRLPARYSNLRVSEIEWACGRCVIFSFENCNPLCRTWTNNSTLARVNLFSWLQTNWTRNWFIFPTIHENLLMRYSTPGTFLFTGDWLDRYLIRWWYPPYQVTSHHPSPDPLSIVTDASSPASWLQSSNTLPIFGLNLPPDHCVNIERVPLTIGALNSPSLSMFRTFLRLPRKKFGIKMRCWKLESQLAEWRVC